MRLQGACAAAPPAVKSGTRLGVLAPLQCVLTVAAPLLFLDTVEARHVWLDNVHVRYTGAGEVSSLLFFVAPASARWLTGATADDAPLEPPAAGLWLTNVTLVGSGCVSGASVINATLLAAGALPRASAGRPRGTVCPHARLCFLWSHSCC